MLPVSEAFKTAARHSSKTAFRCDITDASGAVLRSMEVIGGTVNVDGTTAIRRSGDITIADPNGDLTPSGLGELLSPANNELRLYGGFHLPTGPELVPLGVFRISVNDIAHTNRGLSMNLNIYDRAKRIQRARFENPYSVLYGSYYVRQPGSPTPGVIESILQSRWPGAPFSDANIESTATAPTLLLPEMEDPWDHLQKLADVIGADFAPDVYGVFQLRRSIAPQETVTATYSTGNGSALLGVSKRLSEEQVYSAVIVVGEAFGIPVYRSLAQDLNPQSPTYVNGNFGFVPYWLNSPLITSQSQSDEAAAGLLVKVTGAVEELGAEIASNPAHEPGDVVVITDAKTKTSGEYILDAFSIPLAGGRMPVRLRKRRTVV